MAPEEGSSGGGFPLKLLIDVKAKKVIFAEAGKDLIDFFFSLMLLPLGTVVSLLGTESVPGTVGNLYESIQNLDDSYVSGGDSATSCEDVKDELVNPPPTCSRLGQGLLVLPWKSSSSSETRPLYQCSHCNGSYVSESYGRACRSSCGYGKMTRELTILQADGGVKRQRNEGRGEGFVKALVTYTITDDLLIAPLSTISCLLLMKDLKVNELSALQERLVMVGPEQGKKILETSLRSKTVLSDIFL